MHEKNESSLCTQCGQNIPASARFCEQCGKPVERTVQPVVQQQPPVGFKSNRSESKDQSGAMAGQQGDITSSNRFIVVLVVSLFVFVVLVIALSRWREQREQAKQSEIVRQETAAKAEEARRNEDSFRAMSPAEHLEQVKSLLRLDPTPESYSAALKHLGAIPPDTPEGSAAARIKRQYDFKKRQQEEQTAREQAAAEKKNAIEESRNAENQRVGFAVRLENSMLDGGMDVKVRAGGQDHTTLFIRWILADRVLVHEWQKSLDFDALRSLGFKRMELTDGYDHTWTWKLN